MRHIKLLLAGLAGLTCAVVGLYALTHGHILIGIPLWVAVWLIAGYIDTKLTS